MVLLKRILIWSGVLVAVGVAAMVATYFIDRAINEGEVAHNVMLEGKPVGRMGGEDLDEVIATLASDRADTQVSIHLPDAVLSARSGDLGVVVQEDAIRQRLMDVNRSGGLMDDFRSWWRSLWNERDVALEFAVNPATTAAFVAAHPRRVNRDPIEPWFAGNGHGFDVQQPVTGEYLDPAFIVSALEERLRPSLPPEEITVPWAVEDTELSQRDLDEALSEANRLATSLAVSVNGQPAVISESQVRGWIDSDLIDGRLTPVFAPDRVEPSVQRLLEPLTTKPGEPEFEVLASGTVLLTRVGAAARRCCAPGITDMLFEAADQGNGSVVALPTVLVDEDGGRARAEALGVQEVVGEFTTRHACCQGRVKNIHRIADLVRGQLIEPGETFSINEFIGPRTRDKGFVNAGVIQRGHFVEDVGGGISQFATTMFNAAFFAGLDFDAYRAHTIYLSRYPRGREATLNYPEPDLAVRNNTPYGVLIWTSYTGSSITVQMYSTEYWEVEQTAQSTSRVGACTRVDTFRTRTGPDGQVLDDSVFAVYRPAEGLDCAGNEIPKPE